MKIVASAAQRTIFLSTPANSEKATNPIKPTKELMRYVLKFTGFGFIMAPSLLLPRQSGNKPDRLLHPALKRRIGFHALGLHHHPAFHGPAGDVKRLGRLLFQRLLRLLLAQAEDQKLLIDPEAHIAAQKIPHPAEHLLAVKILAVRDQGIQTLF